MSFQFNRDNLIHGLDLENMTGVEIGPLVNPVVTRDMGDVKYIDRASTEELRKWYSRDEKINADEIMDIDFVWGEQTLAEATGGVAQFDYCIASHVIEHIPDLITWLAEIASILKVGGVASFAVPDKRYTFDCRRAETTVAELVDNHLNKLRKPSFRHIYDHFSNHVEVDIHQVWADDFDPMSVQPKKSARDTYAACLDALSGNKYIDSHCSVFTEDSFFNVLKAISELGLLDFRIKRNSSVRRGTFEFFVQLEKIDPDLSAEEKAGMFQESLLQMRKLGLSLQFTSDSRCTPKLYFSSKGGFSELETVETSYTTPGRAQQLKFTLPALEQVQLRLDPSEQDDDFEIAALSFHDGEVDRTIPLSNVTALQGISELKAMGDQLHGTVEPGHNDPALLISV